MRRREFLGTALAIAAGTLSSRPADAAIVDLKIEPWGRLRRAFVAHPQIVRQNCALWCWAASISMIFAAHGRQVSQERIVDEVFGARVCAPSGDAVTIARAMSRPWLDDFGRPLNARVVAAYDAMANHLSIDNRVIVGELAANRPLVYCNRSHAMVLVSLDFWETPQGLQPVAAGVLDPWPYSPPYRLLSQTEIAAAHVGGEMTFVAAVAVS